MNMKNDLDLNPIVPTTASRLRVGDRVMVGLRRLPRVLVVSAASKPRRGTVALAFNSTAGYFVTSGDYAVDALLDVVGHDAGYDPQPAPGPAAGRHPAHSN